MVSSRIPGETDTVPLLVEQLLQSMNPAAPFAVATLLAMLALLTMAIKTFLEWKSQSEDSPL